MAKTKAEIIKYLEDNITFDVNENVLFKRDYSDIVEQGKIFEIKIAVNVETGIVINYMISTFIDREKYPQFEGYKEHNLFKATPEAIELFKKYKSKFKI